MHKLDISMPEELDFRSAESYKAIRTNLMFCGNDKKAIVFTSSIASEGKSTVTWNLAISMAESGKKVLFIDADMRKSKFAGRNKVRTHTMGLSHFLSGQAQLVDVICSVPKDNLYVMMVGVFPPNPSELLSKSVFGEMISALKEDFDYIIIDAPPIMAAIDAAVIASVCDGIVLVIDSLNVSRKVALDTVNQLRKTSTPIIGSILNKVDHGAFRYKYYKYYRNYGYYGYYGYYGNYGKDEEEEDK